MNNWERRLNMQVWGITWHSGLKDSARRKKRRGKEYEGCKL